ncbi:MAG: alanine--tRNA ligase-related protein, partial [Syntrophales bacterium LBB04]|nr:alanine--tRNA ligase-related protein [Syntrophales bacterium LBB04]
GFTIDTEGFTLAMEAQREKARESWKGSGEEAVAESYREFFTRGISSAFTGYEGVTEGRSNLVAILKDGQPVEELRAGDKAEIIVAETPFYGEKGGQVGDRGVLEGEGGAFLFAVSDTRRPLEEVITPVGYLEKGSLRVGDEVSLQVDRENRRAVEANHSATHILQAAIRTVLGDHVKQSGSLVSAERFRFDFTHFARIDEEDLMRIETLANDFIRGNFPVATAVLPIAEAVKTGAAAVFDEKYGDVVRVVQMGQVSKELCGGTHVNKTGDIGLLKITHESSIAAGVRRVEAVTGREAQLYVGKLEEELRQTAGLLRIGTFEVAERVDKLLKDQRDLEKEIEALK